MKRKKRIFLKKINSEENKEKEKEQNESFIIIKDNSNVEKIYENEIYNIIKDNSNLKNNEDKKENIQKDDSSNESFEVIKDTINDENIDDDENFVIIQDKIKNPRRGKIKINKFKGNTNSRFIEENSINSKKYQENELKNELDIDEDGFSLVIKDIEIEDIDKKFEEYEFFKTYWKIQKFKFIDQNLNDHIKDENKDLFKDSKTPNYFNPYKTLKWYFKIDSNKIKLYDG